MCRPRVLFEVTFGVSGLAWLPWGWFGRQFCNSWSLFLWFSRRMVLRIRCHSGMSIFAGPCTQVAASTVTKWGRKATLAAFGHLAEGGVRSTPS